MIQNILIVNDTILVLLQFIHVNSFNLIKDTLSYLQSTLTVLVRHQFFIEFRPEKLKYQRWQKSEIKKRSKGADDFVGQNFSDSEELKVAEFIKNSKAIWFFW